MKTWQNHIASSMRFIDRYTDDVVDIDSFDADAILNSAEAELFNTTENVFDDLGELGLDAVSYYASASIALAMDWA